MSEPGKTCSRCSEPIDEIRARVAIESGPLHDSHPVLELCAGCSESLERWMARRGRGRSRRASGDGLHERSHRHHFEAEDPVSFPTPGVLSLQSDSARQILLAVIVIAIFALSVVFFVSIIR
jgi:hypothetical protein